jgi:hypothetical protein
VGVFEGEIRIHPRQVDVFVEQGTIYLRPTGQWRRKITVMRACLAKRTNEGWHIDRTSKSYSIERMMSPGDEYKLKDVTFSIQKGKSTDLSKYWLLFEIEQRSERSGSTGYSYAHSDRDIFVKP